MAIAEACTAASSLGHYVQVAIKTERRDQAVGLAKACVPKAVDHVIGDEADRLHERITDGRPDELEPALSQVAAEGIRVWRTRRYLPRAAPLVHTGASPDELPDVVVEAPEFFLDGKKRSRVADGALDLQSVSHDAGIREKAPDPRRRESRDAGGIETEKGITIRLPLLQDRLPAQTGLRAFEDQELEQQSIVVDRDAPFLIVIRDAQRRLRPRAAATSIHA